MVSGEATPHPKGSDEAQPQTLVPGGNLSDGLLFQEKLGIGFLYEISYFFQYWSHSPFKHRAN